MVGVTRKTKLPKGGSKVVYCRTYKHFNQELFISEIQAVDWSGVCGDDNPDSALDKFMVTFMKTVEKGKVQLGQDVHHGWMQI